MARQQETAVFRNTWQNLLSSSSHPDNTLELYRHLTPPPTWSSQTESQELGPGKRVEGFAKGSEGFRCITRVENSGFKLLQARVTVIKIKMQYLKEEIHSNVCVYKKHSENTYMFIKHSHVPKHSKAGTQEIIHVTQFSFFIRNL